MLLVQVVKGLVSGCVESLCVVLAIEDVFACEREDVMETTRGRQRRQALQDHHHRRPRNPNAITITRTTHWMYPGHACPLYLCGRLWMKLSKKL